MHAQCVQSLSCVPMDCSPQSLLTMEFFRQEYWSWWHFLIQGIFQTQGSNPHLLNLFHWQVDSFTLSHLGIHSLRHLFSNIYNFNMILITKFGYINNNSICQQIWKTQQWPQDWRRSVCIPIPKRGDAKECLDYRTIALQVSYPHASEGREKK